MAKTATPEPKTRRAGIKAHGTTFDAYMVDPAKIKIEPGYNARDWAARDNREHLEEIKEKIRRNGFKRSGALTIRLDSATDTLYLVHAETRLQAVMELREEGVQGLDLVPCVNEEKGTTEIERRIGSQEDNEGKPFTLYEKGINYAWFRAEGFSVQEIADKFGKSPAHVEEALLLADAPEALKDHIREGTVSPSEAVRQIRKHGPLAAERISEAVARKVGDAPPVFDLHDDGPRPAATEPAATATAPKPTAAPATPAAAAKPTPAPRVKVTATDLATADDGPKLSRAKAKTVVEALAQIAKGALDGAAAAVVARKALAAAGLPAGEAA